ncbi:MAG: YihY/virulence factor BrkB family protein [Bacteroidales bacterium]
MKEKLKAVRKILARSVKGYKNDDPVKLAGTTAYFTIFAVAPIFIIIISVVGFVLEEETVRERVFEEVESLIGGQGADFVATIVENFSGRDQSMTGTIIGVLLFLVASTTFFTILQNSLNFVWRVKAKPRNNLLKALKDRLLSFGLILSIGFVLLVMLVVDLTLAYFNDFLERYIDDYALIIIRPVNIAFSFAVLVLIFAMIFRYLPDTKINWNVTWAGAIVTALLFTLGRYIIGIVLGMTDIGVMYGTAGSAVVFILWVFYSSIILFFGAEITKQYAIYYNHDIRPKDYAVKIKIQEVDEDDKD